MALEWRELDVQGNYVDQLLAAIQPDRAASLRWYLRNLEIVGQGLRGLSVPDLEELVDDSPHGLVITWDELVELMTEAVDIYDLVATAHYREVETDLESVERSEYAGCCAVVEIFDSGTYRVAREADMVRSS